MGSSHVVGRVDVAFANEWSKDGAFVGRPNAPSLSVGDGSEPPNTLDRVRARRLSDPNKRFVSSLFVCIVSTSTQRHVVRTSQAVFADACFARSDVVHVPFVSGLLGIERAVSRDYRFV